MFRRHSPARSGARAFAVAALLALAACGSSPGSGPIGTPAAFVRVVYAPPNSVPVDIYVYEGSSRPSQPSVPGATAPQITNYLSLPAGSYTLDVLSPAGAPSTSTPIASEKLSLADGTYYSVALAGTKALRFTNFIEPVETLDQSAIVVHLASPDLRSASGGPVGFAVYDASTTAGLAPLPAATTQIFTFSPAAWSGPAADGEVSGGEYFLTPLPYDLPSYVPGGWPAKIGFAAGKPGGPVVLGVPTLASVLASASLSSLASALSQPTPVQQRLATASTLFVGAHLSIFAIGTAPAGSLGGLIGTPDL